MCGLARLAFTAVVLVAASGAARAADSVCKLVEWGYGYYRVGQKGEVSTYVLQAAGPVWHSSPFGYHAPGYLSCEACLTKHGGLYWFGDQATLDAVPVAQRPPASAQERTERRKESWGYPFVNFSANQLEPLGAREDIRVGPLAGFAVAYRLLKRESAPSEYWANILAEKGGQLFAMLLTDGCVSFETVFLGETDPGGNVWASLDQLLAELTITRSPGAVAGPPMPRGAHGTIVRPRRDDEKPRYFPSEQR